MNTSRQTLRIPCHRQILSFAKVSLVAVTYLALIGCLQANTLHMNPSAAGQAATPTHATPNSVEPLRKATERPVPDHKADAKGVVDKLVAGDYEGIRKTFNAQMRAGLSADKMKEVWVAVVGQLGKYKSQGQPHSANGPGGYEIVVIRCQMENGEVDVEVDYDPDGLIGGLWVRPLS